MLVCSLGKKNSIYQQQNALRPNEWKYTKTCKKKIWNKQPHLTPHPEKEQGKP